MALRDDFLRMMAEEAAEQAVHEAVSNELKAAVDSGASGKEAAKRSLKSLFGPAGPVMALARTLPGWTFPLLGTAVSSLLKKSTFVDRLLPGDDRPGVKEAKWLLKNVGPHALLGAFTGYRSVATAIDQKIDEARSDAGVAPGAANRPLDRVVVSSEVKGAFVPTYDDAGNVVMDGGAPMANSALYVQAKDAWDRAERERTHNAPRGPGRPAAPAAPRPFPSRVISLSEAIDQGYLDTATPADLSALQVMLRGLRQSPRSRGAQMSDELTRFMADLSSFRSTLDPAQQMEAESIFEDVAKNGDLALLERAAALFGGAPLTRERFDAVLAFFDDWVGAELNIWEKAIRAASRAWRNRGELSPTFQAFVRGLGYTMAGVAIVQIVLFFLMVASVGIGYFCPPSWGSAMVVGLGSLVIMAMFFQLPIIQAILKVPARMVGASQDWLSDLGRRMTFVLMPVLIVAVGLTPLIEVSYFTRFLILMLVGIQICRGMGFKVAKQFARADLLTYTGAQNGWLITFGIVAIDWMSRAFWPSTVGSWIAETSKSVWPYFNNQWGATFGLFVAVFMLSILGLRRIYRKVDVASNGARFVTMIPHSGMTVLAFVFAVAVAVAIPWFTKTHHEFDPLGVNRPAAAATIAPVPVPVPPAATTTPQLTAPAAHRTHSGALNCHALSKSGKVASGCP